jgi:hypothetical protein
VANEFEQLSIIEEESEGQEEEEGFPAIPVFEWFSNTIECSHGRKGGENSLSPLSSLWWGTLGPSVQQ